jgi:hypothetical protein
MDILKLRNFPEKVRVSLGTARDISRGNLRDCATGETYVKIVFLKIPRFFCRADQDTGVGLDLGKGCVGARRSVSVT